jgi:amino acid transporter
MAANEQKTPTVAEDNVSVNEKGVLVNADDELLAQLGYKAELKRNFSVTEVFGIAFSIMSLMPSIASTIQYSLLGGPVGMTWGWLIPSICILSVGTALGELGSALPTSGGLYWWTFRFAPKEIKRPLCFVAGYSNTLGLIGATCSISYGFATIVMSLPGIQNPDFEPDAYQTYAVFVGAVISFGIVGSVATSIVAKLQTFCIVLNAVAIVITVIALPIGAKNNGDLQSAHTVFTEVQNNSGWPTGWTFFMSWMCAIWTIGAFDSCIHMAEEASNAAKAVPLGIVLSIGMCGIVGFAVMAIIAACIPDYQAVMESPFGNSMTQIYFNALGRNWATGIVALLAVIQWFMGLSIVIAASRQCWAFSRDGALPFSGILRVVNYKLGVPIRALWFICIVSILIGLLSLIGPAATDAIFSLAPASNGFAWLSPIICRAIWFKKDEFTPGPFYLGHFCSRINAFCASTYLIFAICVLSMFPNNGPGVDQNSMNYTCVINGAVWLGSLTYYIVDARKWFTGPKTTLDEQLIEYAEEHGGDVLHHHH